MVNKILKSKTIKDIVDMSNYDSDCKRIIKLIHPDVCKDKNAHEAFIKFQELKNLFDQGFKYQDDSGDVVIKENKIFFKNDIDQSKHSVNVYNNIMKVATDNLKEYLPLQLTQTECITKGNLCSLVGVTLPEEHVRWILNRLLEFVAYMEKFDFVHAGLNMESFLVNCETHGINVISFYHSNPVGSKLKTISAKYKNWYPDSMFKTKMATTSIDVTLVKSIACNLLGDPSGRGIKLKGNFSTPLINFLTCTHDSAYDAMIEYKEMLKKNYESKFYELKL